MQDASHRPAKDTLMLDRLAALTAASRGLDRAGRYEDADALDLFARRVALNFTDNIAKGGAAWVTDPLPPGLSVPGLSFAGGKGMYWTKDPAVVQRLAPMTPEQLSGGGGWQHPPAPAPVAPAPQASPAPQSPRPVGGISVERAKTENEYWWVRGITPETGKALGMAFSEKGGGRWGTADGVLAAALASGTTPLEELVQSTQARRAEDRATRRAAPLTVEPAGRTDENGAPVYRVRGNTYKYRQILTLAGVEYDKDLKEWTTTDPSAVQTVNDAANDPKHPLWAASREDDSYSDEGYSEDSHRQSYSAHPRGTANIPVPEGLKLEPFQEASAEFILERKGALLFDEPGVGKTASAIVVINADPSIRRVLVICPASVKEMWRRQMLGGFGEPTPGKPESIGWLTRRDLTVGVAEGDRFPSTDVVIINFDILPRHKAALHGVKWDYVIQDESHKSKEHDVSWTEVIIGKHKREAMTPDVGIQKDRAVVLTGTPSPNAVEELWSQLHFARPDLFPTRAKFEDTFCVVETVRREFLRTTVNGEKEEVTAWVPTIVGMKNLELLNRILFGGGSTAAGERFDGLAMRRLQSDLGEEHKLPEKKRDVYGVDNPHDLSALVQESGFVKDMMGDAGGQASASGVAPSLGDEPKRRMEALKGQVEHLVSGYEAKMSEARGMDDLVNIEQEYLKSLNADFGEIAQYRRLTGLAKVDASVKQAVRYLEEPPQPGLDGVARPNKVVVFAVHNEVVERIAARLQEHFRSKGQRWKVAVAYGPTGPGERVRAFDGVQGDPDTRVIVISTAVKEGVTLTGANRMVVAEFSWTPGDMSQIEARIHRKSQDRPVNIAWMVLNDSLDGTMLKKISQKSAFNRGLMDYRLPMAA